MEECSLPHQMRYSLLFSSSSSSKDIVTVSMFFAALASGVDATLHPSLETMGLGLINDRLSSRSKFSLASLVNLKCKAKELQTCPFLSVKCGLFPTVLLRNILLHFDMLKVPT